MKVEDFHTENVVFQIGVPPVRIDLLTSIAGVAFDDAWTSKATTTIDGLKLFVIGRNELLRNKRAAGRPKDLADVAWLEQSDS